MEYHEFRAMNTGIVLAAEEDPRRAAAGFREAQKAIEADERRLTRFSENSELSRLNHSQGAWFQASPDLFEILCLAQEYFHLTGGIFDPSILPALKQAGYDRSMDEIRLSDSGVEHPQDNRLSGAMSKTILEKPNFGLLALEKETHQVWLPSGMEIDLGGIAKGWIAGRALQVLAEYAQTCAVNAGGDIVFQGVPDRQSGWLIALEDPRDTSQILAMLKVGPGAVATSSITKRSWIQAGKLQHHLIDPRNSQPAITQWLSVTVIAAQTPRGEQGTITPVSTPAVASEVFAKVLLITGLEETFDIAPWERNFSPESGEFAFIAVDRAGKLWGSPNSMEYLDVHTNNL